MRRRRTQFLGVALFVAATGIARADKTDDFVRNAIQRQKVPGLSLAVIKDGKIIKAEGYVLANVELKIPATPETVYRIGRSASSSSPPGSCCSCRRGSFASKTRSRNILRERPLPGRTSRSGIC